jgi:hypothetical protein
MPDISDILAQLQQAREQARQANLQRYQAGLQELQGGRELMRGLYEQAGELTQDIGASAAEDISRGAEQALGRGRQDLISSGLSNTTITGALMRGVEADRARAMRGLTEDIARSRANLLTQQASAEMGAAGGISDFIRSRADVGPDPALYAGLIQQAAASGGGEQGRRVVSGGLGPMASAGLDAFGRPLGRFGGGGGAGGGGSGFGQKWTTGGGGGGGAGGGAGRGGGVSSGGIGGGPSIHDTWEGMQPGAEEDKKLSGVGTLRTPEGKVTKIGGEYGRMPRVVSKGKQKKKKKKSWWEGSALFESIMGPQ